MWTSLLARHIVGKNYFCKLRTASTAALQPKLYVLQYDYVADSLEKRKPHREAHLAMIGKQNKAGNVVLAGAVDNPPTGGLLIFRNLSPSDIEQLAQQDPYVINGVVKKYTIKPYMAVIGDTLLKNDLVKI
jgi:uncharacterized protein YciI